MNIISVYNDFNFEINKDGGYVSGPEFNGISKRAELKFIDWLSGNVAGEAPPNRYGSTIINPEPYTTQKVRDWLSPFTIGVPLQVTMGKVTKPADYYGYENSFLLGDYYKTPDCDNDDTDDDVVVSDCNIPIELLSNSAFYTRCNTYIRGLEPSFTKPICKMVGQEIEFAPKDIGSIKLEYVRYPVYGELKMKFDPVYNQEVPDPDTSLNYEWNDYAREYFIFFLIDTFANSTRESALKQFNAASKP